MNPLLAKPLDRRHLLRGLSAAMGLPMLEAMLPRRAAAATRLMDPLARSHGAHPRVIWIYHPLGVHLPTWNYEGTLAPLAPHKQDITLVTGLANPTSKGGHAVGDTWLSCVELNRVAGKDYTNGITIDQVVAGKTGVQTRLPSVQISMGGGSGAPGHSTTLSFDFKGTPIPSENRPQRLFDRMFTDPDANSVEDIKRRYAEKRSILDDVLGESKSLRARLGRGDQHKLDEYMEAVRSVESRIQRLESWADKPKPKLEIDRSKIELEAKPGNDHDREMWIDGMYELSYLGFLADATRVITYAPHTEAGGLASDHHDMSHHGNDAGKMERLAAIDRTGVARLAQFLKLLKGTKEGDGSMLDNTLVVYGAGAGRTHQASDLPLVVAGGRNLGVKGGRALPFVKEQRTTIANAHLSVARVMGLEIDRFADSTGPLQGFV